jgi:hypothetical protein
MSLKFSVHYGHLLGWQINRNQTINTRLCAGICDCSIALSLERIRVAHEYQWRFSVGLAKLSNQSKR